MKLIAALLLVSLSGSAAASGIVEASTDSKRYASRKACEKALRGLHSAAAARLTALPEGRRQEIRLETPFRDDGGDLSYFEVTDNSIRLPELTMPSSQTDEYSCKGRTLEHRFYLEGGGYVFQPPPPPAESPPVSSPPAIPKVQTHADNFR